MGRSTRMLVAGVGVALAVVMLWASAPTGARLGGDVGASGAAPASERSGAVSDPAVVPGRRASPAGGDGRPSDVAQPIPGAKGAAASPGAAPPDVWDVDPRAPGSAWRSDREQPVSTAGDVQLQPPAARPEVWDARRAEAHRDWTASARGAVTRYAEERGWDASTAQAVSAVVSAHLAEVGAVRVAIGDGTLPPRQGRETLREAAEAVRADLSQLLGATDEAALRVHLQEAVRGGVY